MRSGILVILWAASTSVYADTTLREFSGALSGASVHASRSVLHGLAASGQVTLAVSAAPLAIGASVLLVGGSIAGTSANAANSQPNAAPNTPTPIGTPLPITHEVITLTPPNVALQPDNTERKP